MDAVIYAAKSTEDEKGSIARQLAQCRAMAEREGWDKVAEYHDENKSGYHGSRGEELECAMAQAEELAPCVLLVHHSDRLARGDAKQAKHLVEYALWALKTDVSIRSVKDDETFTDISTAASQGQRNTNDSRIKGERTAEGLREAVERGEWRGGTVSEGYDVQREIDARGRKVCTVVKDLEGEHIFDLIWSMALEGKSALAISLELDRRGYKTAARRKDRQPQPFTLRRVGLTLNNPFYAGLQAWGDEHFEGHWPRYIEPEDFWRLKAVREGRTRRTQGRLPEGEFLLSRLATCGLCGAGMRAMTSRPRKDGSRRRQYVCGAHRDHHPDSPEWCPAKPIDAEVADRLVLNGIDALLTDTGALREQLQTGRRAERKKAHAEVERARADAEAADTAAEKALAAYADALSEDEVAADIALKAAKLKRAEAARARSLIDAALDALALADDEPEEDAIERLAKALAGQIDDAVQDVRILNAALAESFRFDLTAGPRVKARLVGPALFKAAVAERFQGAEFPASPEFVA